MLVPPDFREEYPVKRISADRAFEDIEHDVIALYVLGNCRSIEIHGEGITAEKREKIRGLCKKLIGYEIGELSSRKIVIQDLLNTGELTMEKAAKRMFSLVFLMFDDLVRSLNENDAMQYREMAARRTDLERACLLVSRMYVEKMNIKKVSLKEDISLVRAFYYRLATETVENIGDLLADIALHLESGILTEASVPEIAELCGFLRDMFRDSFESFKLADRRLANDVISRGTELDSLTEAVRATTGTVTDPRMEIMFDAFGRLGDRNSKIARLAIELSHL